MNLEPPIRQRAHRPRVSLAALAIAVVATAAFVSAAFVFHQYRQANHSSQPSSVQSPVVAQASKVPTPEVPEALSDEALFKLAAPSVVLLQVYDKSGLLTKTGSGFVAAPDGTVITNYHMIRGAYSEKAVFQDGSEADVIGVLGYGQKHDIAAIRVNAGFAKPLALGDSDKVEVGDRVVAIGSPRGLQNTLSDGLISSLRPGLLQTSAPISPGSSGGPFLDANGHVIGVAVSGVRDAQNLNFMVPINEAKPYLRNSTLTKLSDLTEQNQVVIPFLKSTLVIPANQTRQWPILIDRNWMDEAEFQGTFESVGGLNGAVRVEVQDQATHRNVYDTGAQSRGKLSLRLKPGAYMLSISNKAAVMFSRRVSADFSIRYVK